MAVVAEYEIVSAPRFSGDETDIHLYDNLVAQRALWNHLVLQLVREFEVSIELRYTRAFGRTKVSLRLHGRPSEALQRRIGEVEALLPADFRWRRIEPDLSLDTQSLRMARIVRRLEYIDLPVPSPTAIHGAEGLGLAVGGATVLGRLGIDRTSDHRRLPDADTSAVELLSERFCIPLPGPLEDMRPRQKAVFQELQRAETAAISVCIHPMVDADRAECQRLALNWKRFLDPFAQELASAGFGSAQSLRAAYDRYTLPPGYLVHASIRVASNSDSVTIGLANVVAASLGGVRAFQVHPPSRNVEGLALHDRARDIPSLMSEATLATLRAGLEKTLGAAGVLAPRDPSLMDFMLHSPHLFTLDEAEQVIRLPLADDEGLPGFESDAVAPFVKPSLKFIPVANEDRRIAAPPEGRVRIGMTNAAGPVSGQDGDCAFVGSGWHSLDPVDLTKHAFIVGSTGSGKTMTTLFLVRELIRLKVPLAVIEPVKTEYYERLKRLGVPDLRRFRFEGSPKTGGPGAQFLVFDPLRVPSGVTVARHCSYLKSCFEAAFPMEAVLALLLENSLVDYYTRPVAEGACGLTQFTRGGPQIGRIQEKDGQKFVYPSYKTFMDYVLGPFLEREFPATNSNNQTRAQDFKDIYRRRMVNLDKSVVGESFRLADQIYIRHGGAANFYDTLAKNLLSGNVIIELDAIPDASQKALVMAFLLTYLFEYRQAEDLAAREEGGRVPAGLRHFLIIEEAHRLLASGAGSTSRGRDVVGESSQAKAVGLFVDLLAEVRAFGQGLAIVEQIPTKIVSEAVKNTNLKIMLRLTAKDDREYLGEAMNFTDAQMRFVTNLKVEKARPGATADTGGQINFVVFEEGVEQPLLLSLPLPPIKPANTQEQGKESADWLYDEFF